MAKGKCGTAVRHCAYEDCARTGLVEEMVRAPTGEWYCVKHAGTVLLPAALFAPAITWRESLEPAGPAANPPARLLGAVTILGVPHHVDAVEVREGDGGQCSVEEEFRDHVQRLLEIEDGGPLATVEIDSRQYVFLVTPFQD